MKDETKLTLLGRDPQNHQGIVNPPVYHASTILYPTLAAFKDRASRKYHGIAYGAHGTPTALALASAVAQMEGGYAGVVASTGLAAITVALTAFVKKDDHILVADSVYGPTRDFCDHILTKFGVITTYYDPILGADIADLIQPRTRLVYVESPGSLTFEVQDVPAIAAAAHQSNILVLMDNTWGTPLFFKPFAHGVDVSIQAGTKYIGGHSDLVIGVITAKNEQLYRTIKDTAVTLGEVAGPDDCYLALRGLRTMGVRLRHQEQAGLAVARWLKEQPEVKTVLYPALPDDPGHEIWKRDFLGASSLFSAVLHTDSEEAVSRMVNGFRLFKIGASWGGYESLVYPTFPGKARTVSPWREKGFVLRFHIGLEATEDLIADLSDGFKVLRRALG